MSNLKFTRGEYFLDDDFLGLVLCEITRVENYRVYFKVLNRGINFNYVDWFHPKSTFALNIKKVTKDEAMVEML
jgi:hypothetical protein